MIHNQVMIFNLLFIDCSSNGARCTTDLGSATPGKSLLLQLK